MHANTVPFLGRDPKNLRQKFEYQPVLPVTGVSNFLEFDQILSIGDDDIDDKEYVGNYQKKEEKKGDEEEKKNSLITKFLKKPKTKITCLLLVAKIKI